MGTFDQEQDARDLIARILDRWDEVGSAKHHRTVAGKIYAHRDVIVPALTAVPSTEDRVRLRQQQTARWDDHDWLLERKSELQTELAEVDDALRSIGSPHVDRYDADERGRREDAEREAIDRSIEDAPAIRLDTAS